MSQTLRKIFISDQSITKKSVNVHFPIYLAVNASISLLSVVLINIDQRHFGKIKIFFYCAILFFLSFSLFCFTLFCLSLYFHITVFKESQDRTSAGTCSQRLKERLWWNAAYWDAPCSLLSKFFYSSQPIWPGWHIPEWVSCLPISASN